MNIIFNQTFFADTICLSETAKRFNEKDRQVLERIEQIMDSDTTTRHEVYQQLIKSKNSLPSNFEDLLMKDMKEASNGISHHKIAVPSISGFLVQEVLNTSESVSKLEDFQSQHQYKGIVILGIKNDDPNLVQRDLAFFFPDPDILQMVRKNNSCSYFDGYNPITFNNAFHSFCSPFFLFLFLFFSLFFFLFSYSILLLSIFVDVFQIRSRFIWSFIETCIKEWSTCHLQSTKLKCFKKNYITSHYTSIVSIGCNTSR